MVYCYHCLEALMMYLFDSMWLSSLEIITHRSAFWMYFSSWCILLIYFINWGCCSDLHWQKWQMNNLRGGQWIIETSGKLVCRDVANECSSITFRLLLHYLGQITNCITRNIQDRNNQLHWHRTMYSPYILNVNSRRRIIQRLSTWGIQQFIAFLFTRFCSLMFMVW